MSEVKTTRVEKISDYLTYIGESNIAGADVSAEAWAVKRVSVQGLETVTDVVSEGVFDKSWEDRATLFQAIPAYSLDFNGIDEYGVTGAADLRFSSADSFTVCMWIKPDVLGASNQFMGNFGVTGGLYKGWAFYSLGKTLAIDLSANAIAPDRLRVFSAVSNQLVIGVWQHIAITYDGSADASGVKMYYNGTLLSNAVNTNALTGEMQSTNSVAVGCERWSDGTTKNFYDGLMDEIGVYNAALDSNAIGEIYNAGYPGILAGHGLSKGNLRHWYQMGEGFTAGGLCPDIVGGATLTCTNMDQSNESSDIPA